MNVILRQPRSFPSFGYQEMAEGTRFQNPDAAETIGPDLAVSFRSQSLTEELEASEAEEEPIKPGRTR
ncbi:MAG: hypothetical protein ABI955_13710 [Nitrospirota bacterium]